MSTVTMAAILLGAGGSRRFGAEDKLLARIGGEALVVRVARRLGEVGFAQTVAVVAAEGSTVATVLSGVGVRIVVNPDAGRGMGASIAAGVTALGADCDGVLIVPGDMPGLSADLLRRIAAAFRDHGGERIVYPALGDGEQRNPVAWPRRFFPALASLAGQGGGKALLAANRAEAISVPAAAHEVADIDTADDLARWLAGQAPDGADLSPPLQGDIVRPGHFRPSDVRPSRRRL
jgi:molybdenum cofactor cytidylyltransferase